MTNSESLLNFNRPDSGNIFLRSDENVYLYEDLYVFEEHFYHFLQHSEYNFDGPVGLLAPSSDLMVFIIAACWNLGIPFVHFNPESPKEELANQISRVNPSLIFSANDLIPPFKGKVIPLKTLDLDEILKSDRTFDHDINSQRESINSENVFGYFFTSGTSGSPKIVPLKRRQLLFAAKASANNLKPAENHLWLLCMPLNHIGGISIILRSLLYGSGIYRMDSFKTDPIARLLSKDMQIQAASLVPTMLKRLMELSDFTVHKRFQAILLGGGPINKNLIDEARSRKIPLILSYGMTESCAQIAANALFQENSASIESVGKMFSPNEIDIRDEDGESLPAGESGTIWLHGPQVFDGYKNRSKSDYLDKEGWFNTGDFGRLDGNNNLFIETRRSDLIISGGENISPYEVEAALESLSEIKEAAVIGLPDEEWGQKVAAAMVVESGKSIDPESIRTNLKKHLSNFKIPKVYKMVEKLPKNRTGKISRKRLSELFESD